MGTKLLGSRLRWARIVRGLIQLSAVKALDLPRTTITQLEAGSRSVSTPQFSQLSDFYSCSIAELLEAKTRDEDQNVLVAL